MTAELSVPLHVPEAVATAPAAPLPGEACTLVILGASGDLTRRKLMPSLFHLMSDGYLSDRFSVIGVGGRSMSDDAFRDSMRDAIIQASAGTTLDPATWARFAARLSYFGGDLDAQPTYGRMRERLQELERDTASDAARNRLFYLALPPSLYETTLVLLSESGLAPRLDDPAQRPWVRIIIEKPFGRDLQSAQALNKLVRGRFAEHQIFRIDHYLGKDTVQNLLVFRFANSIFEPIWNRDHIHHIQITAAESVGIGHRAQYYEKSGVIRDMFQNHLLQLLALTAIEPPVAFRADAVRTEKVKVFDAIQPLSVDAVSRHAVRGQYGAGTVAGEPVPGYRQEAGVAADSVTPTYAAVRVEIDNWRWQGVPFILRSGKRLPRRATEIAIRFRQPPHLMFPAEAGHEIAPNVLTFRIQPDEGLSLGVEVKVQGLGLSMATARMDFSYAGEFGPLEHSAYETLLMDCMLGDATLFTRSDGVEAAWRVMDPILEAWEQSPPTDFPNYHAGTWGPTEAESLIARADSTWRRP